MDVIKAIESRRAIRDYDGKPIPKEQFKELFRLTSLAPSGFNLQPWKFLLLTSMHAKQKLYDNGCPQQQVLGSSAMVIVLGSRKKAAKTEEIFNAYLKVGIIDEEKKVQYTARFVKEDQELPPDELRLWTMRSTQLASMTLMLAAKGLGIDTGGMEGFDDQKVRAAFKISEQYEICMLISMGYAKSVPPPRQPRLPYTSIVEEL